LRCRSFASDDGVAAGDDRRHGVTSIMVVNATTTRGSVDE